MGIMTTLGEAASRWRSATVELMLAREELAQVIRREADAGASQAYLARETGYTREHIWRIVHNRTNEPEEATPRTN